MEEPFVSVVSPFYNTAPYLAECIESVLGQSYQNFEYVLVDNQSTDDGAAIVQRYAAQDPRIRLVRTPRFFTQMQNYNFGLSQAAPAARYTKIAQADDWLFPRCLTEMVAAAEAQPTAAVIAAYLQVEKEVWGTGLPGRATPTFMTGRDAARLHLTQPIFLFGSPNSVMYRADAVRSRTPFFEEDRIHPDTEVIYELLERHDFSFVHQVLSFTRQQEGSITWEARNMNLLELDRLIVVKRFGRTFLNPSEYDETYAAVKKWFHAGLAREWLRTGLRFKNEKFWARQRRGLESVGESIDHVALARAAAVELVKSVPTPLGLVRQARQ